MRRRTSRPCGPPSHASASLGSRLAVCLVVACGGLATCGCSLVGGEASPASIPVAAGDTAARRPPPQTLPLEVFTLRHRHEDEPLGKPLWLEADEQFLDRGLRERLAANGLRAGLVPLPLPAEVTAALSEQGGERQPGEPVAETTPARPPVSRRVLRLLPGQTGEVVANASAEELVVLRREGIGVRGGTYRDASAVFLLRADPDADGTTRLELVPVIRHGPRRRDWVGEDGAFRLETGQQQQKLEDLRITISLPADAMLLLTACGDPGSTIGDAFFRGHHQSGEQTVLAIRPLVRSTAPLFATNPAAEESSAGQMGNSEKR